MSRIRSPETSPEITSGLPADSEKFIKRPNISRFPLEFLASLGGHRVVCTKPSFHPARANAADETAAGCDRRNACNLFHITPRHRGRIQQRCPGLSLAFASRTLHYSDSLFCPYLRGRVIVGEIALRFLPQRKLKSILFSQERRSAVVKIIRAPYPRAPNSPGDRKGIAVPRGDYRRNYLSTSPPARV